MKEAGVNFVRIYRHLAACDSRFSLWLYPIIEHASMKEVMKMGRRRVFKRKATPTGPALGKRGLFFGW
jgi:hypothetical protein